MRLFTDNKGREWSLSINVASGNRIKAHADVDLLQDIADGGKLFVELTNNPFKLATVLWVLCEPQATEKGIGPEDFAEGLAGDCILAASERLIDEIIDFFPSPRRAPFQKMMAKAREADAMLTAKALHQIEALDVTKVLDGIDSASNSLASPG